MHFGENEREKEFGQEAFCDDVCNMILCAIKVIKSFCVFLVFTLLVSGAKKDEKSSSLKRKMREKPPSPEKKMKKITDFLKG